MKKLIFSIIILLIVLLVELYFSKQANYTVGALFSALMYIISFASVCLSIFFHAFNRSKVSIVILIAGVLAVVPYNIYYACDLQNLKAESDSIVHWVYQQKLKTGTFPKTISSKYDSRITYTKDGKDGFILFFYVATSNTGHFFNSKDGWCYMDD